jgi:hypothetical protein
MTLQLDSDRFRLFYQLPLQTHVEVPDRSTDANFPADGDLLEYRTAVGKFTPSTPPVPMTIPDAAVDGTLLIWNDTTEQFEISTTPWLDPAYGEISVKDAAVTQAVTAAPAKLAAFDTDGLASLVTADHTDDSLEVLSAGKYKVVFTATFSYAAAAVVQLHIRVDAVESQYNFKLESLTSGDVLNGSCHGILDLAVNEKVTVYVEADSDANITVSDAQLTLERIGG